MTTKRRPRLRGKPTAEGRAKALKQNAQASEIARASGKKRPAVGPEKRGATKHKRS